jgi:hypothetical protein
MSTYDEVFTIWVPTRQNAVDDLRNLCHIHINLSLPYIALFAFWIRHFAWYALTLHQVMPLNLQIHSERCEAIIFRGELN